ncbi:GNAT family N-acetyltransferase [Nostoc sp. PA-18-2419]|uniref:GNAT family N-acetyltransferase n=1 Tax=Nostoc sp. PA-18-2419 TaxID=2575443 RepID=UPI001108182D|nr:GNAT family N-acetyltransferase [Nostoc sp. PA-18-2419]
MNFTIRKVKESDAQAIFHIIRELGWFAWVNSTSQETSVAQIQQQIIQCYQNNSHSIYIAENSENDVVGYVAVHWLPCPFLPKLQGYISELFIQKAARGFGIGKTLLATIISEAKIRECSVLMLVNHKERESYQREFYRKQGWVERETVANFIYPLNARSHSH